MSLSDHNVQLQPYVSDNGTNVANAWEKLAYRSVEVISTNRAALDDFADECVYIAMIQEKVRRDLLPPEHDLYGAPIPRPGYDLVDVGLLYLQTSSLPGTFDIGIALIPEAQGRGIGPQALHLAVRWAFGELSCHRIQARVIQTDEEWML